MSDRTMVTNPGYGGASSADFTSDIYINLVILDDGRTFIALSKAGTPSFDSEVNLPCVTDTWRVQMYGKPSSFTLVSGAGSDKTTQMVVNANGSKKFYEARNVYSVSPGSNPARFKGTVQSVSLPAIGADESVLSSLGYVEVEPVKQWSWSSDKTTAYYYVAGVIFTDSGNTINDTSVSHSRQISITKDDIAQLFEYFPWERRISDEWWSLNRSVPGAGLYRMRNNSWGEAKNQFSSEITSKDHGFVYNNGWKKSPLTGKGA